MITTTTKGKAQSFKCLRCLARSRRHSKIWAKSHDSSLEERHWGGGTIGGSVWVKWYQRDLNGPCFLHFFSYRQVPVGNRLCKKKKNLAIVSKIKFYKFICWKSAIWHKAKLFHRFPTPLIAPGNFLFLSTLCNCSIWWEWQAFIVPTPLP